MIRVVFFAKGMIVHNAILFTDIKPKSLKFYLRFSSRSLINKR